MTTIYVDVNCIKLGKIYCCFTLKREFPKYVHEILKILLVFAHQSYMFYQCVTSILRDLFYWFALSTFNKLLQHLCTSYGSCKSNYTCIKSHLDNTLSKVLYTLAKVIYTLSNILYIILINRFQKAT